MSGSVVKVQGRLFEIRTGQGKCEVHATSARYVRSVDENRR